MTKLQQLFSVHGQSPWLDNLTRGYLTTGELQRWVDRGVRGITSNPTIFAKAIEGTPAYDDQFSHLVSERVGVEDAYWRMVIDDIVHALETLRPLYDASGGGDGYASIELDPGLALDTEASITEARSLHGRIDSPNLLVKIPATAAGVPAIHEMIAEGRNINITLIFSIDRYAEVIEAYLSGLERLAGDLSSVQSVASFFVSRVDTEVDRRLEAIGTEEALALRGRAAVAQAVLAYQLFCERFAGQRWDRLADRGAHRQRPLWASTSTKNPTYPDTLYVDELIGPDTINTMPEATLDAFEDHGSLRRQVDADPDEARRVVERLGEVGVDLDDVTSVLENEGIASFAKSYDGLLAALERKGAELAAG